MALRANPLVDMVVAQQRPRPGQEGRGRRASQHNADYPRQGGGTLPRRGTYPPMTAASRRCPPCVQSTEPNLKAAHVLPPTYRTRVPRMSPSYRSHLESIYRDRTGYEWTRPCGSSQPPAHPRQPCRRGRRSPSRPLLCALPARRHRFASSARTGLATRHVDGSAGLEWRVVVISTATGWICDVLTGPGSGPVASGAADGAGLGVGAPRSR